jgi:hypothetical protein
MKHLATAIKLGAKLDRVDRLTVDWIGRGMSEKRPEDFEEASERSKWYDLRDSWEKANRDVTASVNKFIQETGYSPILRFAREEDQGIVYLGLNAPQAKGYRKIELSYPQWFEALNLQTENMSEDQVLNLVQVERLTDDQERTLRESFVEDLRAARIERFADYMARYEATVDKRRTYNENVLRVANLVEEIQHERALALPRPTAITEIPPAPERPLAILEKPPAGPPERPPSGPAAPPAKISRSEFDVMFDKSLVNWNTFNVELLRFGLAGEIHYTVPEREAELVAKFTPDFIRATGKADVDAQRETSWKTYNASFDRKPGYGEFYLEHLDDIVHTLSRKIADKAFAALLEESRKPIIPSGPSTGLSEEQKHTLEDAFKRVFEEAGVRDIPMSVFRDELERLQEDLKTVERARAYELARKVIVDVATGLLPKRPAPEIAPPPKPAAPPERAPRPPVVVSPVEALGPRRRDILTVQCWVPTCLNECIVDKDLMRRVSLVPVLKGWSPRGARYEPLLALPPLFFYSCEEHKNERFGYRSVYDALAYLLFESRSSTKRLAITKGTFADIGLDQEDINTIQAAEAARWAR